MNFQNTLFNFNPKTPNNKIKIMNKYLSAILGFIFFILMCSESTNGDVTIYNIIGVSGLGLTCILYSNSEIKRKKQTHN